jgi:hypothetical protein
MRPPPCRDPFPHTASVLERQALSRQQRAPGYSGARHAAWVVMVSLGPAVAALVLAGGWGGLEIIAALGGVLVGSAVVYFSHRYPMHRRMRGLELAYDVHTGRHHMMFDAEHTEIASIDDMHMVMLPPGYAAGLCGGVVPVLALPWLAVGLEPALVFAAVCWLYYLAYELVHWASHGRVGGPLDRVPGLGWLLRHHRRHHAWPVMHHGNFSMLMPLWDWVMGTLLPRRGAR